MRPASRGTSGVSISQPIVLNAYGDSKATLQLNITGTATVTVEQTADDLFDSSTPVVWFPCPDAAMVGATADKQGGYNFLPFAVRLNQTAGTGSARLTVLQAGG